MQVPEAKSACLGTVFIHSKEFGYSFRRSNSVVFILLPVSCGQFLKEAICSLYLQDYVIKGSRQEVT